MGGQERLTGHASTANTTSGMAVLPVEAKLLLGKILEVNSFTLSFKVSVKRTNKTMECHALELPTYSLLCISIRSALLTIYVCGNKF